MPNIVQKWIYNLSAGAPLLIVFAIVWYCEKKTWTVSIICICAAILLMMLMVVAFAYGKRNLPPITINVTDVSPHGKRQIVLNRRHQKDVAGSGFAYRLHDWQPW